MATLRLFANLRESAGTSSVTIPGDTVGEVVDEAVAKFGTDFAAGLEAAKIWVNGQPAERTTSVETDDEIALIPPVSGGETVSSPSVDSVQALLVLALLAAVVIASYTSLEAFVFVVVGAGLAWLWDLNEVTALSGTKLNIYPALAGPVAAATGAYAWGITGFAGGVALTIVIVATWPVFDQRHRSTEATAVTMATALAAALGAGGLIMLRIISIEAVTAFLIVAATGSVGSWLAHRYGSQQQWLDPNVGALLGSLIAGIGVGLAVDSISMAAALLGAVATAIGIIAGRALGSLLRVGTVIHTVRAPGMLTVFDGAMVAAPLFWLTLRIFG